MVHKGGPQADAELWGDDEEGGDDELDREWRARREEHWSSGYREGVEVGKHEAVQAGFDEGESLGQPASCSGPACNSQVLPASGFEVLPPLTGLLSATSYPITQATPWARQQALSAAQLAARQRCCERWRHDCLPT